MGLSSLEVSFSCSHLAKVCAIAKDLEDECERLWHYSTTSEIVRGADKVLVQAHQYIRSEQDVTPVVACSMDVDFSYEGELLQLVDSLGELLVGESLLGGVSFNVTATVCLDCWGRR